MKKILFLMFVCVLSTTSYAQKIKKSEVDKFTKTKIVETSRIIVFCQFYGFRLYL